MNYTSTPPGTDLLCVSCICAGPLEDIRKLFRSNMFNMKEATCVKSQGLISENGIKFHILFINCSLEGVSDLVCWNVQERDFGIIKTSTVVCWNSNVHLFYDWLKNKTLQHQWIKQYRHSVPEHLEDSASVIGVWVLIPGN